MVVYVVGYLYITGLICLPCTVAACHYFHAKITNCS